jgi:glycosyltransferase involved in cell wall biosynthesis
MKVTTNIKISLGMPVLNGEKHIHYALDGIFKQTFKNFKLIIYDNASTDKTVSICEKYKKKYKHIVIYKQKKRVSGIENWISVLKKANSKYFLFCAHDDVFKEKEYLSNLVNKISTDTIPFGTVNIIDEKNNFIKHICNNKIYNYDGPTIYRRLKFLITPSIFGKNNIIYGIQERKHILKIMEFFKNTKYVEYNYSDNYLNYIILKKKKVFPVIKATLLKRVKNHEEKSNFFCTKKNKFKILLDQFNMVSAYTRFSNFLEIIIIIIAMPIYIFYDRISLLFFFISNKIQYSISKIISLQNKN